jgi:hypothetical protein
MKRLRHPIQAIREPFGTAGLIFAMIALVAALGGTALAAAKLNSTQKKEVEKIAKKFAGKPGVPGANGNPGAKGDAGAAGSNGANGANGVGVTTSAASRAECPSGGIKVSSAGPTTKVCNGTTGFTETLPANRTETGSWSIGEEAVGTKLVPISFAIPLSEGLQNEEECGEAGHEACLVNFVEEGEAAPAGCTGGSAAEPSAEPGNLCIYVTEQSHLAIGLIKDPASGAVFAAGATGALIVAVFGEPGLAFGTWAVTAE